MKARSIYSTMCLLVASYFFLTQMSEAKWARMSQSQLVEYSEYIVVAEFMGVTAKAAPESGNLQVSALKVIRMVKGAPIKEIKVYGYDMRVCAPNYQFEEAKGAQYLLFLRKHKDGFVVVNGQFGALRIINQKVDWFLESKEGGWKRVATTLGTVVEGILEK